MNRRDIEILVVVLALALLLAFIVWLVVFFGAIHIG